VVHNAAIRPSGPQEDSIRMSTAPRVSVPVAVVMARREVTGAAGWRVASWAVVGVVSGAELSVQQARGVPIHSEGGEEQFLWGGLQLELYRDAAASYWANLTAHQPALFVLCSEDESGRLVPKSVTADQDEASSGVEVDDRVFRADIPPELYQRLEAFVIEHHMPEEKRRRKRSDWSQQEES
jgi:hypothetical protein